MEDTKFDIDQFILNENETLSHLKDKIIQGKEIVDFDTQILGESYQVHFLSSRQ